MKKRIDRLLVERGLAETRERAQGMIMAGTVLVNETVVTKAGLAVDESSAIRLKQAPHPYVSRGGLKLEGAAKTFGLEVEGRVCVDVGSSTGGFVHYLLLHGAASVYAVDVDVQQLDWKVRSDPRVHPVELNARFLEPQHIGQPADIVTIDASFISLKLLLPRIPPLLKPGGYCVALVKPQFEAGRGKVGKGGIVRDESIQKEAVLRTREAGEGSGFRYVGECESPILGREGNREFFILFQKP